jgi:predicted esterase
MFNATSLIDRIIFPGKSGEYTLDYNRLYRIPRTGNLNENESLELKDQIPFIFLKNQIKNKEIKDLILYFHGNGEEATSQMELLDEFNYVFDCHSAIIEYPKYGVLKDLPKDPERMKKDAEIFFDFFTKELGFAPENIIIFGRSLGTGPATYLASKMKKCKLLLLMSPYKGLKDILADYKIYKFGFSWFMKYEEEHFNNVEYFKNLECPVYLVHGKKDEVIKDDHTKELLKVLRETYHKKNYKISIGKNNPPNMTHNRFHVFDDLLNPLKEFIKNKINPQKKDTNQNEQQPDLDKLEKYQSIRLLNIRQNQRNKKTTSEKKFNQSSKDFEPNQKIQEDSFEMVKDLYTSRKNNLNNKKPKKKLFQFPF